MRPAIHAKRPPHQTRPPPHDHEENALLAGRRPEPEQNGRRQNASLKTRPRHTEHAGTCRLKVDNEHCPAAHSQDTRDTEQPSTHGCCYFTHGNDRKTCTGLFYSSRLLICTCVFSLKDSFVYFDIFDNINALLPKMKFVLYISPSTSPATLSPCLC